MSPFKLIKGCDFREIDGGVETGSAENVCHSRRSVMFGRSIFLKRGHLHVSGELIQFEYENDSQRTDEPLRICIIHL
jgi:hypothetical protein